MGRFVRGMFCSWDVLSVGRFVTWDVLSMGIYVFLGPYICVRFCPMGCFVRGTLFMSVGHFVPWYVCPVGRFVPWDVLS